MTPPEPREISDREVIGYAVILIGAFVGLLSLFFWFSKTYQAEIDKELEKIHEADREASCDPYIYEQYYKY